MNDLAERRRRKILAVLKQAARAARDAEGVPSAAFTAPIGNGEIVAAGTESGIHALTAPPASRWILTSDRLPKSKEWESTDGCFYVWSAMLKRVRVAFYDRDQKCFIGLGGVIPCTRWMPVTLPDPPEI